VHTQTVFADPPVVAQAGGAVVAGAGGYLSESVSHGDVPLVERIVSADPEVGYACGFMRFYL
jgi:hypothetical protein